MRNTVNACDGGFDQKELKLSFQYIYDPIGDPQDHRDLMTGTEAMAFEVKRNMDRLDEFLHPEKQLNFTGNCTAVLETGYRADFSNA